MNPQPEKKSEGGIGPKESASIPLKPLPEEIPTRSRLERFAYGLVLGGLSWFFSTLLYRQDVLMALVTGTIVGFFIGGLGALFGKRLFNFLMEVFRY